MNQTLPQNPQQLQDAFLAFSRMSEALEASYRELEQRVAELNVELAASRSERLQLAERLETLVDALPGGVLVVDGEGRIRECNRAAESLLGVPLSGRLWAEVSERAFNSRRIHGAELRLADGRWVNIASRELEAGHGRILLLNDVTETRQLQAAMSRQQRLSAMGEMVAGLAHQIRTPLSTALLYASQLAGPMPDAAARERFAGRLVERLHHLERLVDDMLLFARGGEAGDQCFDCAALFASVEAAMQAELAAGGARLQVEDRSGGCLLQGNPELLAGALANLVSNSLQADGTTRIRIEAGSGTDGGVWIRVSDDGPGIPPALRERIFQPFFTTRPNGTGLGLALVQSLVRSHGGAIELEDDETQGASFMLRFPPVLLADVLSGEDSRRLNRLACGSN
ncbi:ATP-binding protein [Thiohalobacter sp. IOR34]|uniref:sensor histidine kinase n=1 Tax=Thiohalobacter sp. IOR34 TaxID=3057176 RepID=UPI0025AFA3A7|nr:ATP-binding protein [Thiohalobacter sp. IOR34]WJW74578.1 ATP-binding protein [Thiohalobacter sp. IOR34]